MSQPLGTQRALVDILLATCNGERYLPALLDSLLDQSHQDWRLLVGDDASTDATLDILETYRPRLAGRLQVLPAPARQGVVRNFERLMRASQRDGAASFMSFCDQDDVWLPSKLATLLAAMRQLKASAGAQTPCLVHCDLRVVDEALALIHPSFIRHQRYDPARCSATALLSVNQVTGCAMMIDAALLELALPIPDAALMHDWWCALLAARAGLRFVDEPLVLYRQHRANQLGAKGRGAWARLVRLCRDAPGVIRRVRGLGTGTRAQAGALATRLAERGLDNAWVRDYLAWREAPLWRRVMNYRSHYTGPELDRCARLWWW
ncbi:glycosyltransferase family 2 protein [Comamonas sp. SCN 65-56]|uniref:glycosyltransferase family 2 protein n=1 Tax=Comamonas sp. SCN 65-56 TaxID=1660095 RepID=UPI000AAF550C|nr:glycosyltransferase family 2 protein [Comamonas sp. SCN 65-56]